METIALTEGDVHWMFPDVDHADEVAASLRSASAQIELLAAHLGVGASWTGSGLEFHRYPGQDERPGSKRVTLFGCAECVDVSFVADLDVAPINPNKPGSCVHWEVEATISVRCDREVDCGHHIIEERNGVYDSPSAAARGLAEAASWLHERGSTEPLTSWRQRDHPGNHPST